MRILHVGSSMPDDWGGIERYVAALSRAQAAMGHDVEATAWPGSPLSARLSVPQHPARVPRKFRLAGLPAYLRLFTSRRFDIVVPHFSPDYDVPLVAARMCGQRGVVVTRHMAMPLRAGRARSLARLAEGFVGVSQASASSLVSSGLPPDRVRAVLGGCEPLSPTAGRDAVRVRLGMEGFCVGYFGRLVEEKGILVALEACRLLPSATLHVFGGGPLKANVESAGHVRCHGVVADVSSAMSAVDAVILPTTCEEALGMALLEAMSLGRPVVASAVGGVPEAVTDQVEALLIAPGQPIALANAVMALADDPGLARRLGNAARDRFYGQFTPAHMARRATAAYEELIGRPV